MEFRQETAEEKTDFKPILYQAEDIFTKFRAELAKTEQKFLVEKKPYCARCARLDFKDSVDKQVKAIEEQAGYQTDMEKFKFKLPDLEIYGKAERFKLIGESKAMEPISAAQSLSSGQVVRQVQIGVHKDYQCSVRGCGISIFTEAKK